MFPDWLDIVLRSTLVYLALLAGLRLAGKRHSGQLSPHDFVLILLVSNAVQNAMVGNNVTLHGGLLSAGALILVNVLISRFVLKHRGLTRYLVGRPTMLIYNGAILRDHLDREGILFEELEAQLRCHGFECVEQVKLAVQECDGSISVIGFYCHHEHRMAALARSDGGRSTDDRFGQGPSTCQP